MGEERSYRGLDYFRLIAALLVVANHTSVLSSYSETGDFLLTRVIARVAVPFFFMTTGYFLISGYAKNTERLSGFLRKTVLLYLGAIGLYLPINCYQHYFTDENFLPKFLKDLFFDGTFYHLWYFPATVWGAGIAWVLVRKWREKGALLAAALLYLIGLFGDSYYGYAERVPLWRAVYDQIFKISDRTRNGIFLAPVFLVLGSCCAKRRDRKGMRFHLGGFLISFALMTTEALFLRAEKVQRHDSMYVFLLPCMYFLFRILTKMRGGRPRGVRTISLLLYLLHPWMILFLRGAVKILHAPKIFLKNSLLCYLSVCALSLLSGALLLFVWERCGFGRREKSDRTGRAYLEINLKNLRHNARTLKEAMPPSCRLMAVVKAGAYGHGAYEIAVTLDQEGVEAFAVATIDEGIELRRYGVRGEILILGYTDVCRAAELKKYDLTQTLIDSDYAKALDAQGKKVKAHIKIDTGMHRLGTKAEDVFKVEEIFGMRRLQICGIFTHLCCAEGRSAEDIEYTKMQADRFWSLLKELERRGIDLPKIHMQSSYGFLNYPSLAEKCDYVRAGIALYGVPTSPQDQTVLKPDLRPVLTLKSRIVLLRTVGKGDGIGYDRGDIAERDGRIAVLPIGYADGFPRSLSKGKGFVLIGGKRAPILGKICMDQMTVDVTDIENVKVGDEAILIGEDADRELGAAAVADRAGSISNELLSRMGARLQVVARE